jgi:hypothetical protein
MINPEAIKNLMLKTKQCQIISEKHGVYKDYFKGEMAGFADCLLWLDTGELSIDTCQGGINVQDNSDYGRGVKDAYIQVGMMLKTDAARDRRAGEVRCATRYAQIQQGKL